MKWQTTHTLKIKSKYVYRYMSSKKLINFLQTGSLYFARMDTFEDNLEGMTPFDITELIISLTPNPNKENRNPEISDEVWNDLEVKRIKKLNFLQEKIKNGQIRKYVNCWYLGDAESIGMWDLYGSKGFMIRFERKYLQNLVRKKIKIQNRTFHPTDLMVAGKVNYQDFEKIPWQERNSLLKYSGFRKHIAFKHEEEYRFIIHSSEISDKGVLFDLGSIENLDFQIYTNPRTSDLDFKSFDNLIKKYSKKHRLIESKLKPWLQFKEMRF